MKEHGFTRKEVFSIPNIMGYFRILLIPIFTYLYFKAQTNHEYYIVAGIVLVSTITDMFDGIVARRFNMITELGKFIDPFADKLTHIALVICLASRYRLMIYLIILMVVKEGFMAIMGIIKLKKYGKKLDGAKWFGKVCTATLFIVMFLLILLPQIPVKIAEILIIFCMFIMLVTLGMYIPVFKNMK